MSYRVVVVPEDPTNNGYILKPLVKTILDSCGKPRARIDVLTNPRTQGYEHAKTLLKTRLITAYSHVDLLLFLPDADGKDRAAEFDELERIAVRSDTQLVCCAAVQEVETWLLAGHVDKLSKPWQEVRADPSVKENVFQPFLKEYGDPKRPGSGREDLMRVTVGNYAGLKARCSELQDLEARIQERLRSQIGVSV